MLDQLCSTANSTDTHASSDHHQADAIDDNLNSSKKAQCGKESNVSQMSQGLSPSDQIL